MKITSLVLITYFKIGLFSKDISGYILTKNNDSLKVHIHLSGIYSLQDGEYSSTSQLTIIDSSGLQKILSPDQINGFGYMAKGTVFNYRSMPTKSGIYLFLRTIYSGDRASVYRYETIHGYGNTRYVNQYFTFLDSNNNYLYLSDGDFASGFAERLLSFYKIPRSKNDIIKYRFLNRSKLNEDVLNVIEEINRDPK